MIRQAIIQTFRIILTFFMLPTLTASLKAQTVMPLYPGPIPNSRPAPDEETSQYADDGILSISKVSRPELTVYLPQKEKAVHLAIVVCPGGGYWNISAGHEGSDVARRLNQDGIAAFVLKYRIPDDHTMVNKEIGPLQDAQRAIQIVRSHSKEWGINPNRIGILGFSAGGHLAASAGTHFNKTYISNPQGISLRPDFMILIYPVISFTDSIGHIGSRDQLLGKNPSQEKIMEYSNELQVTDYTPPAFLVHAKDDDTVPYANSIVFAEALKKHRVPVKLLTFEKGGHGFGLINKTSDIRWMDLCLEWLKQLKIYN